MATSLPCPKSSDDHIQNPSECPAIDPRDGKLIALVNVRDLDWIPRAASGKKLDKSTAIRWAIDGLLTPDGERVHLRSIRVGRTLYTDEASLLEFFAATSPRKSHRPHPARVARRNAATAAILQQAGIGARRQPLAASRAPSSPRKQVSPRAWPGGGAS